MTKKQMAELEVWARARFELIAPELANFGLTDIAFNDPQMGDRLLRPSSRLLPRNGEVHFGVKVARRRPASLRRHAVIVWSPRRYPRLIA